MRGIFETNPELANKPKTRKQKNRGAGVEHRDVSVECSKQTQNSETRNRGAGVEPGINFPGTNSPGTTLLSKSVS